MSQMPHTGWAGLYDAVYEESYGESFYRLTRRSLQQVQAALPPPARLVDFGAGTGRLAIPLAEAGYQVTAVEPCQLMLDELLRKAGPAPIRPCACRMQDFRSAEKFDLALCVFTVLIYFVEEDSLQKSLQAAADALRPGGLLLMDIPLRPLFQSNHIRTPGIDRDINIQPLGGGLYQYDETTTLQPAGRAFTYSESFKIRHWPVQQVKDILADCSFTIHTDLSAEFFEWGAKYLLLQKSHEARPRR